MTRILDRRTLVFALAVLALVLAMTSAAWAAGRNSVDSRAIKNGSVKNVDLAAGAVTSAKVRDGKLTGVDLADGSVGSADLANGSVGSVDLANGAVSSAHLADDAVTGTDIANSSVDGADLADDSVGSADLANGSIMSADIADGTVSDGDIGEFAVGASEFGWVSTVINTTGNITDADGSNNGGQVAIASATASCPAGTRVISGGAEWINASSGDATNKNLYIHTSKRSANGWFVRGIVDFGAQGSVQLRVYADCLMEGPPLP